MSEELSEPAGAEEPATAPPGDKVYICPACGTRYAEPTTCSNGHEPTETVEYDRATVEAADGGDAAAIESVNETAASAGTTAGVATASAEAIPPTELPPAAPAEAAAAPAAPAAPAEPVAPAAASVEPAASPILEALTAAKNAIEAAISHATGGN